MIILTVFLIYQIILSIQPIKWYKTFLKQLFKLPFIQKEVDKELKKMH
jgi:hypothetical protein